ncbi:hypothetical protein AB0F92_16625 [Kitasatospora aureofaciens]|uniref:hypothetical protein n=1 Tax=Kitasatospora aureofaciens TaxID=1894 RepID=UPI0033C4E7D5
MSEPRGPDGTGPTPFRPAVLPGDRSEADPARAGEPEAAVVWRGTATGLAPVRLVGPAAVRDRPGLVAGAEPRCQVGDLTSDRWGARWPPPLRVVAAARWAAFAAARRATRVAIALVATVPAVAARATTGPEVNAAAEASPTTLFAVVTASGTAGRPPRVCSNRGSARRMVLPGAGAGAAGGWIGASAAALACADARVSDMMGFLPH